MKLILNVISVYNRPPSQKMLYTFSPKGGTIGRKITNSWVLPDQQRHLSGCHAKIESDGEQFYIVDTSTNGVFINDHSKKIGKNNRAQLENGMRITMGGYVFEVSLSAKSPLGSPEKDSSNDPFTDFEDDVKPHSTSSGNQPESQSDDPDERWGDDASLVEDPFFGKGAFSSDERSKEIKRSKPDTTDIPELDSFFKPPEILKNDIEKGSGLGDINEPDSNVIPDDWNISNKNDSIDALLTGFEDPFASKSKASEKPQKKRINKKPKGDDKKTAVSDDIALNAFLKGVGLNALQGSQELSGQHMELVGRLFRTAIQGTMEVLQSRAEIKNEMRMDMTTIQPVQNNPIKFSVNVDEALKRLLVQDSRSFMNPEQAILEAFDDIKAHQIAIIAGIQASLVHVLKRFEPEKLVHRLEEESPISSNIPVHRQSKLWEKFEELYDAIEGEAEDDFNRLFGQEFAKAYDEQIKKLKSRRNR